MDIEAGGQRLLNLAKVNVLLGKNGSGKSTTLRKLDQNKSTHVARRHVNLGQA